MKNIIELEAERFKWSMKNFPFATDISSLDKLIEEADECKKAIRDNEDLESLKLEYADCLMCLFDSAGRYGVSVEEIFEAFEKKLKINKKRKWKKNPDNTYSHIK